MKGRTLERSGMEAELGCKSRSLCFLREWHRGRRGRGLGGPELKGQSVGRVEGSITGRDFQGP